MALPPTKLVDLLHRAGSAPEAIVAALAEAGCLVPDAGSAAALVAAVLAAWKAEAARMPEGWTGPSPQDAIARALSESGLLSVRGLRWAGDPD